MITLGRGNFELDIAPEVGGAISRFEYKDRPVLRPVPQDSIDVLEMASFPLVPYANRIAHGTFGIDGKTVRLPLNFGTHPHSLHGHGWQSGWETEAMSRERTTLSFEHAADAWGWSYTAEQVFMLLEDGLKLSLSLTNRDTKPMPYSLGLHPYFPRCAGSKVAGAVNTMWLADDTMLPTELSPASTLIDLSAGQKVALAPFVDNTFTGWRGPAVITQPELGFEVALKASANAPFLHVFIPQDADFFCVEPTSAMPNAFNRPEAAAETGAAILAPGATATLEMELTIRDL